MAWERVWPAADVGGVSIRANPGGSIGQAPPVPPGCCAMGLARVAEKGAGMRGNPNDGLAEAGRMLTSLEPAAAPETAASLSDKVRRRLFSRERRT